MRARKPETIVREQARTLKATSSELATALANLAIFRARATKAEQEVAEWKRRFDALLQRTPPTDSVSRTVIPTGALDGAR